MNKVCGGARAPDDHSSASRASPAERARVLFLRRALGPFAGYDDGQSADPPVPPTPKLRKARLKMVSGMLTMKMKRKGRFIGSVDHITPARPKAIQETQQGGPLDFRNQAIAHGRDGLIEARLKLCRTGTSDLGRRRDKSRIGRLYSHIPIAPGAGSFPYRIRPSDRKHCIAEATQDLLFFKVKMELEGKS